MVATTYSDLFTRLCLAPRVNGTPAAQNLCKRSAWIADILVRQMRLGSVLYNMRSLLITIARALILLLVTASTSEATPLSLGVELLTAPIGSIRGTPELESSRTDLGTAFGISPGVRLRLRGPFYFEFAPQVIWRIQDAEHERFAATRDRGRSGVAYNLLSRLGATFKVASSVHVGVSADLGHSWLGGSLNSSDATSSGAIVGLNVEGHIALTARWSLRPRLGYQWGFQRQSDEDDTQRLKIDSRFLQVGLGIGKSL